MPSSRSYRRVAAAAALASASFGSSTGVAAASGDDVPGAVIEAAGDPATAIALPPAPVAGATADATTTIDVGIGPDGTDVQFGLRWTSRTAIDQVASDGGRIVTATFGEVTLTSAGAPAVAAAFDLLTGAAYRQTFRADGAMTDAQLTDAGLTDAETSTGEQRRAFESVVDNLRGAQTIYPAEPVGVGARWTVEQPVSGDSFPVTAEYHYELTAIVDGRYTVAVSYHSEFDTVLDGLAVTGTVAGLGSINGSVTDPLDVSYRLGQATDSSSGGSSLHVAVTIEIESTPT